MSGTAQEVFQRHFPGLTPAELDAELGSTPPGGSAPISAPALDFLRTHGGPEAETAVAGFAAEFTQRDRALHAARAVEQVIASSITLEEAAAVLGVSRSRISHRLSDRSLYAASIQGRRYLPRWQFAPTADGTHLQVLPGIAQVVAALPAAMHPLAVDAFMTTPLDGLERSPVEHLWAAGDVQAVVDQLVSLGHG